MYMASGVNKWFQYYLLDKKVIAFVVCMELGLTFYSVVHSFHNKLKAILSYKSIYSPTGWLSFEIEHFCALLTPKGRALEVSSLEGAVHIAIQTDWLVQKFEVGIILKRNSSWHVVAKLLILLTISNFATTCQLPVIQVLDKLLSAQYLQTLY